MIAVTEARSKLGGAPKVVERWGEPESSRCVLAASTNDRKIDPVCSRFHHMILHFKILDTCVY